MQTLIKNAENTLGDRSPKVRNMTVVFKLVRLSAEYIRYAFVFDDRSHLDMRSIAFQVFASGTSLYGVRSIAPYRAIDRPSRFLC